MTETSRRVALLVRPGVVADRLREMLAEAGIESVLQGDPTVLEADVLAGSAPQVVLVALDPETEDAIERFDAVLGSPDVDVIYEEAELAAAREGWEQARWKRHLLAKLQGHDRVLPPRPDGEAEAPTEGLQLQRVAELSDEAFHAFDPTVEAPLPVDPVVVDPPAPVPTGASGGMEVAVASPGDPDAPDDVAPKAADAFDASDWDALELAADDVVIADGVEGDGEGLELVDDEPGTTGDALDFGGEDILEAPPAEPGDGASLVFDASAFDPALAEAGEAAGDNGDGGFEITYSATADSGGTTPDEGLEAHLESLIREATGDAPSPPAAAPAGDGGVGAAEGQAEASTGFGELTLDDGSGHYSTTPATASADERFGRDLAELDARISGLELVDDSAGREDPIPGAALVLAGIGGPDAVRQLLGALPADFSRPVLVQQRLDGGRYDRLVAQMQRATSLPVHLAEPGKPAMAGFIYMIPAGVGISAGKEGLRFQADGDIISGLPAADSAVILLSGADGGDVDQALKLKGGGALVAGQAAEGCYDATASDQLVARGAQSGQPAELAQRLAERWPA